MKLRSVMQDTTRLIWVLLVLLVASTWRGRAKSIRSKRRLDCNATKTVVRNEPEGTKEAMTDSMVTNRTLKATAPFIRINFGRNVAPKGFDQPVTKNLIGRYKKFGGGRRRIVSTNENRAYASHVWAQSNLRYMIDGLDPQQAYDVVLGFAESITKKCHFGSRVFSATVQQQTEWNIDVFQAVGCRRKYDLLFANTRPTKSGRIRIKLSRVVGRPFLAVVEVAESQVVRPTPPFSSWMTVSSGLTGRIERFESCFVAVGGLGFLVGGRGIKPIDVYDPSEQTWTQRAGPGVELHHMQCVAVDEQIWIASAWAGEFPFEEAVEDIYIYNTISDSWSTRRGLPPARRRGAAATVYYLGNIYVSHGSQGGHGPHATSSALFDKYNIATDTWSVLPLAPNARDHTGAAVVNGRMCVAAGRDSGSSNFFNKVVKETDCFDFVTQTWSVEAKIPQGRAGSAYGQTCDGKLMVAGGEGFGVAWPYVDVFDGSSWETYPELHIGRHGTGLAVMCECDQIHIAGGSVMQGQLATSTTETYGYVASFKNATCAPAMRNSLNEKNVIAGLDIKDASRQYYP